VPVSGEEGLFLLQVPPALSVCPHQFHPARSWVGVLHPSLRVSVFTALLCSALGISQ
jgi:hypothetical protein